MANLNEGSTWENNIYQLETSDPVLGGPNGIANQQAKQLASRTNFLRSRVGWFSDSLSVTGNTSLTASHVGKTILLKNTANATITLPVISSVQEGQGFAIIAAGSGVCGIAGSSGATIFLVKSRSTVYLYKGEHLYIIKLGNEWFSISASDSITRAGKISLGIQEPFTVIANGSLLSRENYPRLAQFIADVVNDVAISNSVTSESNWPNGLQGCFSQGDVINNLRVPDLRGKFLRGLDLSSGIDIGRGLGSYQQDDFASHSHIGGIIGAGTGGLGAGATSFAIYNASSVTGASGGNETRPKNVAYNPLICY